MAASGPIYDDPTRSSWLNRTMAFQDNRSVFFSHDEFKDPGFHPINLNGLPSAFPPPSDFHRDRTSPIYRAQSETDEIFNARISPPPASWSFPQGERPPSTEQLQMRELSGFHPLPGNITPARLGYERNSNASPPCLLGPIGEPPRQAPDPRTWEANEHFSHQPREREPVSPPFLESDFSPEPPRRRATDNKKGAARYHSQRRAGNRDEFDGPVQLLEMPSQGIIAIQEAELPNLPTTLDAQEQDAILCELNDRLSRCAFHFIAKYQFPVPIEPDKRQVRVPTDREWTEWAYLLKRLATKRRIPARVLYNGQIKQFVTVLENSLEMRHAAKHQSRPVKDDRNILQLISAGTQVAKILKDAVAMRHFDRLYVRTENLIRDRRERGVNFTAF